MQSTKTFIASIGDPSRRLHRYRSSSPARLSSPRSCSSSLHPKLPSSRKNEVSRRTKIRTHFEDKKSHSSSSEESRSSGRSTSSRASISSTHGARNYESTAADNEKSGSNDLSVDNDGKSKNLDEFLKMLGESDKNSESGPPIDSKISKIWTQICQKGLAKENKDILIKKYLFPENCKLLKVPNLNSEIKTAISKVYQRRDYVLCTSQNQLGLALSAVGMALTQIMSDKQEDPENLKKNIFEYISDAGRLLTDLQHELSVSRRCSITPVRKQLAITVAEEAEIDTFLYGQNFPEKLKAANEIEKVGKDVARQDQFDKRNDPGNSKNVYRKQY